jgi:hypothetical protein
MKKVIPALLSIAIISANSANAQQGLHSSGGNASGQGGSVSYSVGQVFYSSQSGSNGSLIQGVQQPFELVVTALENPVNALIRCEAFPNPAVKELNLRISGEQPEKGNWKLLDLRGVSVLQGGISEAETLISVGNLPMATYTLQLFSDKKILRSFKVIKQ